MRAKTFALAAIAVALLIAPVACTSTSTDNAQMQSQQITEKYQEASQKAVPYKQPTNWLERTELNEHLARQDDLNAIRYIVLMTQQGQIIGQYTLKGMVFDPNSQCPFLNLIGEASAGDPDHGPADHGFVMLRQTFVVTHASAMASDPRQSSFYHPSSRKDHEPDGIVGPLHDPHGDLRGRLRPVQEFSGITTISPDQPNAVA